jgi:hypothetical protein
MIRIYPYRTGSRSASSLASALGGRVLLRENSRYRYREGDTVINWGSSNPPSFCTMNSNGEEIGNVSNKLSFFRRMAGSGLLPRFWEDRGDIPDDAFPVVCRTLLTGSSGRGIHIADDREGLVDASLYVEYKKKREEYRIHLGRKGGAVQTIAIQKKATRTGEEPLDWRVRSHGNGFIFVRNGFDLPDCCFTAASECFSEFDLDFGAIDVIYNERSDRAYVLEINSAPGLQGQTIQDYYNFFKGDLNV